MGKRVKQCVCGGETIKRSNKSINVWKGDKFISASDKGTFKFA